MIQKPSQKPSNKTSKRKCKQALARVVEPRNPLFNHPLMKKSHVHLKSNKAKRRAEKVRGSKDWYCQNSFIKTFLTIPVQSIDPQFCF